MKVLITSQYNSMNTYLKDIIDKLKDEVKIVSEPQNFWISDIDFDIVHIQWPEELFYWQKIKDEDLKHLKNRLNYFKSNGCKIVATLHNKIPHRKHDIDQELYDIVYKSSDVIINLGNFSTRLYPLNYNKVIFHPNYSKHFNVKPNLINKSLFLSFGKIRCVSEELQIINGYLTAKIPNSQLIVINSKIASERYYGYKNILKRLQKYLRIKKLNRRNIFLESKKLSATDVEELFNRASVIVVPRVDSLNSGVVFMGMTFGKPIVGPSVGNIKEFLELNGNPVFQPNDFSSIADALIKGINSLEIGAKNKVFSDEYLNPDLIAKQHLELYLNLLKCN